MVDFFEFSNELLCLADSRGYFTRVNPAWTSVLGWSAEELTSTPYMEFVHPDDVAATKREAELLTSDNYETIRFENRYRCRDGSYRWLAWQVVPDADGTLVAAARDVTDQKRWNATLREAVRRFQTLATHAPVGIAQADAEGRIFYVNEKWCELTGITPPETMGFDWQRYVHPEDLTGLLAVWQAALRSGSDLPPYEFRFLHTGGEVRWASTTVSMVKDDHERVTGQIAVVQDVTARKSAEQALRESENRFRHLITHAHVGITQADADGRCIFVNRKWCDIVGVTADQVIGEGWRAYVHPDDHDRIVADWQQALSEGRDLAGETRFVRPGGEIVWVSFATSGLAGPDGRPQCYISTVVDITEQKRARETLEAEQDLLRQSIELKDREHQLIAYDIHDGLIQYAIGAQMHLEAYRARLNDPRDCQNIDVALEALQATIAEGRRVMNGIRTPVLDRHGIVAAVEELAREKSTGATVVEFVPPPREIGRFRPEVEIALYRMSQEAISNAVKHSRSSKVQIALVRDEHQVRLTVKDWGVGIDAKSQRRGVHGLLGIKERVRLLKGRFQLDNSPECGTRIEVELPLP